MAALTPERRFAELVAADGSRPFVTYYDEASGERSELSRKSLANWVAKTRNLLGDELGLGVGDTAVVALPTHWITVPIALGTWAAGLTIVSDGPGDVGFAGAASADASDVFAVNLERAAFGLGEEVPAGTSDFVSAVRPQGDTWASVSMPAGDTDDALAGTSRGSLLTGGARDADTLGLSDGGRLLVTEATPWHTAIAMSLAVGGSLVIVRNAPDPDVLDRRADQERVTARA